MDRGVDARGRGPTGARRDRRRPGQLYHDSAIENIENGLPAGATPVPSLASYLPALLVPAITAGAD